MTEPVSPPYPHLARAVQLLEGVEAVLDNRPELLDDNDQLALEALIAIAHALIARQYVGQSG
jgi:hypothetical protein